MARQKEPTRPLFGVKPEFIASLDAMLNEALMLIQAVEFAVRNDQMPEPIREILNERVKAFRSTLMLEADE